MGGIPLPRCHQSSVQGIEEAVLSLLNYIDDVEGVVPSKSEAESHFAQLQGLLKTLGQQEARHKASPPSQVLVWLGFQFDTLAMTVTLPPEKTQGDHGYSGNVVT